MVSYDQILTFCLKYFKSLLSIICIIDIVLFDYKRHLRSRRSSKRAQVCLNDVPRKESEFFSQQWYAWDLGESILNLSGNSNLVGGQRVLGEVHWL